MAPASDLSPALTGRDAWYRRTLLALLLVAGAALWLNLGQIWLTGVQVRVGLVLLGAATSYPAILVAAGAVGIGSAIFHPEASRVARIASGGRYGMAQSLFQVGGNIGTSIGPLLAAWIILPNGQASIVWFGVIALAAVGILSSVGRWS